jgi:hypothetical protein
LGLGVFEVLVTVGVTDVEVEGVTVEVRVDVVEVVEVTVAVDVVDVVVVGDMVDVVVETEVEVTDWLQPVSAMTAVKNNTARTNTILVFIDPPRRKYSRWAVPAINTAPPITAGY